jgi:E1A-binding protein p400
LIAVCIIYSLQQYAPGSPGSPNLKSGSSGARPLRTAQLFAQDGNSSLARLYAKRFDAIRGISGRRTPTVKPVLVNPTIRNPKHAAVLAEAGIQYDSPLSPVEVATRRAERISREKLKSAQVSACVPYGSCQWCYLTVHHFPHA